METNWRWRPLAVAAVPFLFSFDTTPFSSTSRRDLGVYVDLLPVRRTHRIFGGIAVRNYVDKGLFYAGKDLIIMESSSNSRVSMKLSIKVIFKFL